ncbi:50S ribosomal protein L24 [Candidatus Desantisbacteria bacterium]|nr:50S ribosomal protein L24 [Candidatus Desantisbacteria bacterium]
MLPEKIHIKRDDTVIVLRGKEKGKTGKVLSINPEKKRAVIEKLNIIKRHTRVKRGERGSQEGGIVEKEASISTSNLSLVCPKCDRPSRTGNKKTEEGKKIRICKACNEMIE